ncbi:hypothetical protein A1O1_05057 [Capronia coronata CBS 617.96]|uniref:Enoyl reductase (ER) domain-containing protein n=1 Tax=Capronia coronata CBS 617.96 TaxID=1182541 RepID=W9Z0S6_9EURO|nr:uncharacterized protein A1O1_05057 [Capronia coronata CBS 617.96]EXJ88129.1 hypothetical protein A1O1_05057 [Capronia coronata CBS 617.96]
MGLTNSFSCFPLSLKLHKTKADLTTSKQEDLSLTSSSHTFGISEKRVSTTITERVADGPSKLHRSPHQEEATSPYHDALVVTSRGRYELIKVATQETLESSDVLISTRAVGLNPIDWKSVDFGFCLPEFPWVTGREMSGVVERIGAGVTGLEVGDRVWTGTYYRKREAGCFQSRVVAPAHTVLPVPAGLSFESAACLGVPGLTAAMTLWHWLRVPMPSTEQQPTVPLQQRTTPHYILIWGGSTVTGQFAIQLAVLSGLTVITVTSTKTSKLAGDLGATHVVTRDGKTENQILDDIRRISGEELVMAMDIVGPTSASYAVSALSRTKPSTIAPLSFLPPGFQPPPNVSVLNIEMKQFILNEECRKYAVGLSRLIAQGLVRLPTYEVLPGGLLAIPQGLERLKRGDMAGKKLIVSL